MIHLPDSATFLAVLHHPGFIAGAVVALIAAVVRGFSGFGAALIYVPLTAAIYSPQVAVASFALIDFTCVAPYAVRAFRECHWREVLPAVAAGFVLVPLGTMTQAALSPLVLRWAMALLVLMFVALLASGWRYPFKPSTPAAIGAGALSGFFGGAAQLAGPPMILYWLGSPTTAAHVRANLLVYLVLLVLALMGNYAWHGLMTPETIALSVMTWPVYIVALWLGARLFRGSSDKFYRKVAYVIVAAAAIVSLPVFDRILH
ncbi:MAG TPA: sulfite exporter TauE/SafE family protein [Pseudolabrys sp.]|nr:sulfite exporter TauE/SafE family protein [Pseudolabrys sp.]